MTKTNVSINLKRVIGISAWHLTNLDLQKEKNSHPNVWVVFWVTMIIGFVVGFLYFYVVIDDRKKLKKKVEVLEADNSELKYQLDEITVKKQKRKPKKKEAKK